MWVMVFGLTTERTATRAVPAVDGMKGTNIHKTYQTSFPFGDIHRRGAPRGCPIATKGQMM